MERGNKEIYYIIIFVFLTFCMISLEEKKQIITQLIYGNSSDFQNYFIIMEIGNPPQLLLLVLDSQDSDLYLLCKNICRGCSENYFHEYNIDKSNTFIYPECLKKSKTNEEINKCYEHINISKNQSLNIINSYDLLMFKKFQNFGKLNSSIKCLDNPPEILQSGLYSGIFGIGIGDNVFSNYIFNLYNQSIVQEPVFSICLGLNGGYMTLGGENSNLNLPAQNVMAYSIKFNSSYEIKINQIIINSSSINIQSNFQIDIASPISYFNKIYNELIVSTILNFSDILQLRRATKKNCIILNHDETFETQLSKFPIIFFYFEEGVFEWSPINYLMQQPKAKNIFCIGIEENENENNKLGSNFLQDYQFTFNLQTKQIMYSRADCNGLDYEISDSDEKINNENELIKILMIIGFLIVGICFSLFIAYSIVKITSRAKLIQFVSSNERETSSNEKPFGFARMSSRIQDSFEINSGREKTTKELEGKHPEKVDFELIQNRQSDFYIPKTPEIQKSEIKQN